MTPTLSKTETETIAEPVYDAYRLGKYGEAEYLPMWHELDTKPLDVPEVRAAISAVEKVLADRRPDPAALAGLLRDHRPRLVRGTRLVACTCADARSRANHISLIDHEMHVAGVLAEA